jgi:quercetin dioxygenase-like cupin family protein
MEAFVKRYTEISGEFIDVEGKVKGVTKRVVIGPEQQAPNFYMRVFTLNPEGHSPFHAHDWEHEVFVLRGQGILVTHKETRLEHPLTPGDVALVPPGILHQFLNRSSQEEFEFICIVPSHGE